MSYYHQFSVSFNVWFVILPLMVAVMAAFGLSKYKLDRTTLAILGRDRGNKVMSGMAVAFDVVFHVLVIFESFAGILQFTTNHLSRNDSPVWGVVLKVVGLIFSVFIVYYLLFGVGRLGSKIRMKQLKKLRRKKIKVG